MPRSATARKRARAEFRVDREKFGMTYSCPTDKEDNPIQSHQQIIDFLQEKLYLPDYVVAKEHHADGKVHWHVFVKSQTKFESEDPKCFDILEVHPNIIRPGGGWIKYCTKFPDWESNFYKKDSWVNAMEQTTAEDALEVLWKEKTGDMCKFGENIERNVKKRFTPAARERKIFYGSYPEHYYTLVQDFDWDTYSLHMYGPPRQMKTQFATYLMLHNFGRLEYHKGDANGLRKKDLSKPWIWDECERLLQREPEDSREVTDVENGGCINVKYGELQIPPMVPRIFLSNRSHPFRNPEDSVYGRRVISVYLHISETGSTAQRSLVGVGGDAGPSESVSVDDHCVPSIEVVSSE